MIAPRTRCQFDHRSAVTNKLINRTRMIKVVSECKHKYGTKTEGRSVLELRVIYTLSERSYIITIEGQRGNTR